MANKILSPRDKKDESPEEKIPAYGGYSTRYEYEKNRGKKNPLKYLAPLLLLILLAVFSVIGVLSLLQGNLFPSEEKSGKNAGSIKVPTQSELAEAEKSVSDMLSGLELSLLTLEVEDADGAFRYGAGFLVSADGYGVCCASLFHGIEIKSLTAYTGAGFSSGAEFLGSEENLGVALISLEEDFAYTPISVKNASFVERGDTLFAVSSQKPKLFYGTVTRGVVSSVGPLIRVGEGDFETAVNMIYLDQVPNPTLYGAPAVDPSGAVVGFCTDAVAPLYDSLTSVVPINVVYTVVNLLLAQQ